MRELEALNQADKLGWRRPHSREFERYRLFVRTIDQMWQDKVCRESVRADELGFDRHDQYTTIVRSKPSQMVPNHPK